MFRGRGLTFMRHPRLTELDQTVQFDALFRDALMDVLALVVGQLCRKQRWPAGIRSSRLNR